MNTMLISSDYNSKLGKSRNPANNGRNLVAEEGLEPPTRGL